jgi:hypothetical protein
MLTLNFYIEIIFNTVTGNSLRLKCNMNLWQLRQEIASYGEQGQLIGMIATGIRVLCTERRGQLIVRLVR